MQQRMNVGEMQQYLEGIEFPVTRDELVDYAQTNGANDDVVGQLEKLPDREYSSMAELMVVTNSTSSSAEDDLGM